ncbi:MAG: hypothetical protein JXR94_05045 [Candidatus Hydrogenedentes bacterium]|nr:hypothetical protein [Candidatus Hydrogenedentota bacterium]
MRMNDSAWRRGLSAVAFLAVSVGAWPVPPVKAPEDVRALERSGSPSAQTCLTAAVGQALRAFDAPVSFETHPLDGRSTEEALEESPFSVTHCVKKNETLKHCLDDLVELSRGLLEVQTILGNTCIVPKKRSPDEILTNLDVPISLHVEKASTWEALKALAIAINGVKATDYGLYITLSDLDAAKSPPAAFTEEKVITLSLDNVPARYALCAIMNASPLELSYTYAPGTTLDTIVMAVHKDGKRVFGTRTFTSEEAEWWGREKNEVGWQRNSRGGDAEKDE